MGRTASGVKGISLVGDDYVVAAALASPDRTLLTACANGYGKRTPIGPNAAPEAEKPGEGDDDDVDDTLERDALPTEDIADQEPEEISADGDDNEADEDGEGDGGGKNLSNRSYRTIRRGGKGLRDIKASKRNGKVIGAVRVYDDDEVMMITAQGQIQRIAVSDIRIMGRNTQGVRIMTLDDGDTLVAVKRIPKDENSVQDAPENATVEKTTEESPTGDEIES
jgi:DNA gyrase subunit A